MNTKINSIKNKFIVYFVFFSISIFIILWLMQIFFIKNYYKEMLKFEIVKIGNEIKNYNNNFNKISEIAYSNSLTIIIFDNENNILFSSNKEIINRLENINFYEIINKFKDSNKEYAIFEASSSKYKIPYITYISKKNNKYNVIFSNIYPITITSKIFENQLKYITLILILLSFLMSIYLANRLSKPIKNITKKAKELSKGNYDVTFENSEYEELNTLSETLNYSAKEIKKVDDLKKDLIANVSHDIKTPLTIIKSYAEMIKDISGENKDKREEHLNVIIEQTDLLNNLINDMMDLSKLESKNAKLNIENYDIIFEINKIIKGFNYLEEYKFELNYYDLNNNKINIDNLYINADKTKINQVIYNLISNAVNYVKEDKTITINLKENKDSILVEIIDKGKGIKDTTHIFDRYYKSNDKFRKSGYGTGIGLCIVKNILDLHNFKYGVESKEDEGSNFYFYINK